MAKTKVAPGQIWRAESSGRHYLVTRVYSELFDTYAVLRRVEGAQEEESLRLKVLHDSAHPLPGYRQEADSNLETT